MEAEMDWHLNDPGEEYDPFESDVAMLYGIMTGLLTPPTS